MYLHIKFKDESNPYVFYPRSRLKTHEWQHDIMSQAICKEFSKWKRAGYFPENYFTVHVDGITIEHDHNGTWFIRHDNKAHIYKHLGNAINMAIKIGRKTQ